MLTPFQPRKSGGYFLLTGTILLMLIPFFGDAQIPRCALVDIKTGNEIDVKSGFKASEIPQMKVIVVDGKGEYRVAVVTNRLMRRDRMIAIDETMNSALVPAPSPGPSLIQVGDKLIVKASNIFLKNADGKEIPVTVKDMEIAIQIH